MQEASKLWKEKNVAFKNNYDELVLQKKKKNENACKYSSKIIDMWSRACACLARAFMCMSAFDLFFFFFHLNMLEIMYNSNSRPGQGFINFGIIESNQKELKNVSLKKNYNGL